MRGRVSCRIKVCLGLLRADQVNGSSEKDNATYRRDRRSVANHQKSQPNIFLFIVPK
jgi:hypothetical protein